MCLLQQRANKLSYSAIDNVLTNLLAAGLQDLFYVLNVSNVTTTVNKLLECSPDGIVHWIQVGAIRWPIFWFQKQIVAQEDAKTQLFVLNDELAHHTVEK